MVCANTEEGLTKGLRIRTIKTQDDIERVVRFNEIIWGEEEESEEYGKTTGKMVRGLITEHPHTSYEDFFFIENEETGEILSFQCLVPLRWKYGDVDLKAAIIECVGTLKRYRRRGFIRALMQKYDERLRQEGYDLSVVWGIPYFYRQFGHEYALTYREECTLRFDRIPDQKHPNITIRPMTIEDMGSASRLSSQSLKDSLLHAVRDEDIWLYQERRKMSTEYPIESFIVETDGVKNGYFRLIGEGHPSSARTICILEASDLTYDSVLEVLRYAKSTAENRGKTPLIRIFLPADSPLGEAARYLGAQKYTPIKYLIKIPNVAQFLSKIKLVLDKRIRESVFRGVTMNLKINLFRSIVELRFVDGILRGIEEHSPPSDGDKRAANINPSAFYRLVVGDSSIEEITQQYPDVVADGKTRHILAVLFPKITSYIISGY